MKMADLMINPQKNRWSRDDVSIKIIDFQTRKEKLSQREFAKETGVPRTTFQNWLDRMNRINAAPSMVAFFESPAGVHFLQILIQALHFEFTKVECASIRNICNFLELTPCVKMRLSILRSPLCQHRCRCAMKAEQR